MGVIWACPQQEHGEKQNSVNNLFSYSNKILYPVIETYCKGLLLSQSLLADVDLFYTSASRRKRKSHSTVFWRADLGKRGRR